MVIRVGMINRGRRRTEKKKMKKKKSKAKKNEKESKGKEIVRKDEGGTNEEQNE